MMDCKITSFMVNSSSMKKKALYLTLLVLLLSMTSILIIKPTIIKPLRIFVEGPLFFWIPGILWSYVFWKKLQLVERILFSIALSISMIPITIFLFNNIGVSIRRLSIFVEIVSLIIFATIILLFRRRHAASTTMISEKHP